MTEKFYYKKKLIGIRLKSFPKGSIPHTDPSESLGLVTLKYKKGSYLQSHVHKPIKRITYTLQEAFYVKKGKVRLDLYGPDKKLFKYIFLKEGEIFVALSGGHGFHILKDSEIIETKNGPFFEDKIRF